MLSLIAIGIPCLLRRLSLLKILMGRFLVHFQRVLKWRSITFSDASAKYRAYSQNSRSLDVCSYAADQVLGIFIKIKTGRKSLALEEHPCNVSSKAACSSELFDFTVVHPPWSGSCDRIHPLHNTECVSQALCQIPNFELFGWHSIPSSIGSPM